MRDPWDFKGAAISRPTAGPMELGRCAAAAVSGDQAEELDGRRLFIHPGGKSRPPASNAFISGTASGPGIRGSHGRISSLMYDGVLENLPKA